MSFKFVYTKKKMAPTRQNDIKAIIQETIKELFQSDEFISTVLKKVNEKIELLEQKIHSYEEKINTLDVKVDNLQQQEKIRNICIYGLQEENNEKLDEKVLKLFCEKVNVETRAQNIIKCYRIGNNKTKARPVIVKFEKIEHKNLIFKNCKNLKGSKIVVAEDLIKSRLKLLQDVKEKFDKKAVYTFEGNVYVKIDNVKHKIRGMNDLNQLIAN